MSTSPQSDSTVTMQCLQVWGGTEATNQTLAMTGLEGYLYSRPYQGAKRGGDVYYFSSCSSGRISRVLLADVAGHGEKVAGTAQDLRWLMQHYVNFASQQVFMKALNTTFSNISEEGRFATTIALSFFAPKHRLSISNAGHPPSLWYRARERAWYVLGFDPDDEQGTDSADLPFGIADEVGYKQVDIHFEPHDMLLLYTDALIESRGSDGQLIGVRGLLNRVSNLDTDEPTKLVPALLDRLTGEHEGNLDGDDVTALLLQANGKKRKWPNFLLSPIHAVRGLRMGVPLDLGITPSRSTAPSGRTTP